MKKGELPLARDKKHIPGVIKRENFSLLMGLMDGPNKKDSP